MIPDVAAAKFRHQSLPPCPPSYRYSQHSVMNSLSASSACGLRLLDAFAWMLEMRFDSRCPRILPVAPPCPYSFPGATSAMLRLAVRIMLALFLILLRILKSISA